MLAVLYQDSSLVAINKPAGLLVHRSLIDRHETRFAVQLLRDQLGQRVYPVHRLDKPTSGVLLFALDPATAARVAYQFSQAQVRKTYLALVRGYTLDQATIDYPLREELDALADAQADPSKAAQSAITHYRSLARFEVPFPCGIHSSCRYSWLELQPETGRKHQLRRHLKHIFHPILGDTTHGDGKQNRLLRSHFACQRLLLHAACLELSHPHTGQSLSVTAPLPAEMTALLDALQPYAQQQSKGSEG